METLDNIYLLHFVVCYVYCHDGGVTFVVVPLSDGQARLLQIYSSLSDVLNLTM